MLSPSVLLKAVSAVSDLEYQNLPKYLKLMTLHNINQAIHNINTFTADYSGMLIHSHYHSLILSVNKHVLRTIRKKQQHMVCIQACCTTCCKWAALCRTKDGVSERGAADDHQRWNQDSGHHPLSD